MYQWYKNSAVCFAYLTDIERIPRDNPANYDSVESNIHTPNQLRSRWFTRGWCLQELIAPSNMHFFDRRWHYLGSKRTLTDLIVQITGIDEFSLFSSNLSGVSVARKMSWAAKRETTRVEDIAYCLLGIFDINMPLLYGEGEKAFLRLQEEIIRQTEDHSIFAWSGEFFQPKSSFNLGGALAPHPSAFDTPKFMYDPKFAPVDVDSVPIKTPETWSVTSRGIRIQLPLLHKWREHGTYMAILGCQESTSRLAMHVSPTEEGSDLFFRMNGGVKKLDAAEVDKKAELRTIIYLLKASTQPKFDKGQCDHCWLRAMEMTGGLQYHLVEASPEVLWDLSERIMPIRQWWETTQIALSFKTNIGYEFALLLA